MIRFWDTPKVPREVVERNNRAKRVVSRVNSINGRVAESAKRHVTSQQRNHYGEILFGGSKKNE